MQLPAIYLLTCFWSPFRKQYNCCTLLGKCCLTFIMWTRSKMYRYANYLLKFLGIVKVNKIVILNRLMVFAQKGTILFDPSWRNMTKVFE